MMTCYCLVAEKGPTWILRVVATSRAGYPLSEQESNDDAGRPTLILFRSSFLSAGTSSGEPDYRAHDTQIRSLWFGACSTLCFTSIH